MVRTFSNVRLRFGGVLDLGGLGSFFCKTVSSRFKRERDFDCENRIF